MKQQQAVENFLAGRRVVLAKFVAHHYKEVSNKAKKGRRYREPLRSSMCRREGAHRSSVVSAQRPDGRAGRKGQTGIDVFLGDGPLLHSRTGINPVFQPPESQLFPFGNNSLEWTRKGV